MCNGDYSATGGMDCALKDVSNTVLLSLALYVWRLCVQWVSSGTRAVYCMLEDVSNTILFSVPQCVWRLCVQWGF